MMRRPLAKLLLAMSATAWSIAPLIDVPPPNNCLGVPSMVSAIARNVASLSMRIHGTTCACSAGPVHCIMVTAIAPLAPARIASSSRGSRKAAA